MAEQNTAPRGLISDPANQVAKPEARSFWFPLRVWLADHRHQALLYLAALALAETLTTLIEPRAGMALHGLILLGLMLNAALIARGPYQKFLLALALAPLIRVLSLTMPLPDFPYVYWYFVVGAPLFGAALLASRWGSVGPRRTGLVIGNLPVQLLVGLTGLGLGLLEYLILRPEPLAEELTLRAIWLPALILLVFTGFLEEYIFRGLMQYTGLRAFGRFGLFYVAVVFTVLHLGYRSLLDLVFVFVAAVMFGWITWRTGSILGVTLAHGLTNIALFLIFPFMLAQPAQLEPPNEMMVPPRAETPYIPIPTRTPTNTPTLTPTAAAAETAPVTATPMPTDTPLPRDTATATITATVCTPRSGWVLYIVQPGDSLAGLAQRYGVSVQELSEANCLAEALLIPGQALYLPYLLPAPPPPTATLSPQFLPTATPVPAATDTAEAADTAAPTGIPATDTPVALRTSAPPTSTLPAPAPVHTGRPPPTIPPLVTATQPPASATSPPLPTSAPIDTPPGGG